MGRLDKQYPETFGVGVFSRRGFVRYAKDYGKSDETNPRKHAKFRVPSSLREYLGSWERAVWAKYIKDNGFAAIPYHYVAARRRKMRFD